MPGFDRPFAALLVFAVLAAWTLLRYSREEVPLSGRRRASLIITRLSASLLLSCLIGGLSWSVSKQREIAPRLQVLLDASASMQQPSAGDSLLSRYDVALGLIDGLKDGIGRDFDLHVHAFGDRLMGADTIPARPTLGGTDYARAISSLSPHQAGEVIILLGDGRDRGVARSGSLDLPVPIHAVLLGDSLPPPDLRIDQVQHPAVLRQGEQGRLEMEIVAAGKGARRGKAILSAGGRQLAAEDWSIPTASDRVTLSLPLRMDSTGRHLLELRVETNGQDALEENSRRLLTVEVVESELRILVLAGRPDWDLASLMRTLNAEQDLAATLVTAGPNGEMRSKGRVWQAPAGHWHGLILHSVPASWPSGLLADLKVRGGVLALAPFLSQLDGQQLPDGWGLVGETGVVSTDRVKLDWRAGAARHEAVRGALAVMADPGRLEPLTGLAVNPLSGGRTILSVGGEPILKLRELDGLRMVAFSGRSFWRWAWAGGEERLFQEELLSGLTRWAARQDPPSRIPVSWPGEGLSAGQPVTIRASLLDEEFRPIDGGRIHWDLRREGHLLASGEFSGPTSDGQATLPSLEPGEVNLHLSATTPRGEVLERDLTLPVLIPSEEFRYPSSSPTLMRWLAERSGGSFLTAAGADALEKLLDPAPRVEQHRYLLRLWTHPLFFLLFLSLLGIEWVLRKVFGMV